MRFKTLFKLANQFHLYTEGADKKTAVIIKGDPDKVKNNKKADKFYEELKEFLEDLGFKVRFHSGKPYTAPAKADIWIGHSKGADRLRFAPKNVTTIEIGTPDDDAISHSKDNIAKLKSEKKVKDIEPNIYHFKLTNHMKKKIKEELKGKIDKKASNNILYIKLI